MKWYNDGDDTEAPCNKVCLYGENGEKTDHLEHFGDLQALT